jgi:WD40 repeat protein
LDQRPKSDVYRKSIAMAFNFVKNFDADDIFISYSRADGMAYLTGLDAALSARGFSCFTDRRGTDADVLPPKTLFQKIRACKTLVLLGTPGALDNPRNITAELEVFAAANGTSRIVCVNFNRGTKLVEWPAEWNPYVVGKAREGENPNTLVTGEPSPSVVEAVAAASDYMKSKDRLRKYRGRALYLLAFLVIAIAAAALFSVLMLKRAVSETARATKAGRDAEMAIGQARDAQEQAKVAGVEATRQRDEAARQKDIADEATLTATEKTRLADQASRKAQAATTRADAEQARAGREQAIAESRALANRSQTLLRQHPNELSRSVSIAVEAMKKATAFGIPSVDADTALRESLALLPRLRRTDTYGGDIVDAELSPDGRYLVTLMSDNKLRIYDTKYQTQPKEILSVGGYAVALSNDAAYVAVGAFDSVTIYDLQHDTRLPKTIDVSAILFTIKKLALSPGGRYLAVLYSNEDRFTSAVSFKDLLTGKTINDYEQSPTHNDLDMRFNDLAFGPTGNFAVGGGRATAHFNRWAGKAVIWEFASSPRRGEAESEIKPDYFDEPIEVKQEDEIRAIAVGPDETSFATDRAVWKRTLSGDFEPVTRLPAGETEAGPSYPISNIAFNASGDGLAIVRRKVLSQSEGEEPPRHPISDWVAEQWDAGGYSDVARTSLKPESIEIAGFEPGGARLAVGGYEGEHVFRIADGSEVQPAVGPWAEARDTPFHSPDARFTVSIGSESVRVVDTWRASSALADFGREIRQDKVMLNADSVRLSADGNVLALQGDAAGCAGEFVLVYKLGGGAYRPASRICFAEQSLMEELTRDGRLLAVRDAQRKAQLLDVRTGRDLTPASLRALGAVRLLKFSPEGHFLAAIRGVDPDGHVEAVHVWRLRDGKEIKTLAYSKRVSALAFSARDRYLLTSGEDRLTQMLELATGSVSRRHDDSPVTSAAFTTDERYVVTGSRGGIAELFLAGDFTTEIIRLQHGGKVTLVGFSEDNRLLLTATNGSYNTGESSRLRVWLLQADGLILEATKRLATLPPYLR